MIEQWLTWISHEFPFAFFTLLSLKYDISVNRTLYFSIHIPAYIYIYIYKYIIIYILFVSFRIRTPLFILLFTLSLSFSLSTSRWSDWSSCSLNCLWLWLSNYRVFFHFNREIKTTKVGQPSPSHTHTHTHTVRSTYTHMYHLADILLSIHFARPPYRAHSSSSSPFLPTHTHTQPIDTQDFVSIWFQVHSESINRNYSFFK